MRLDGRESENVEDQRGAGMGRGGMMVGGGMGTIVVLLIVWFLGGNPQALLQQMNQNAPPGQGAPIDPAQDHLATFVKKVLADTEDVWNDQFKRRGAAYREPKLVLFSGRVESACGLADSAVGPFYCPGDQKVYIDLSFYEDMKRKLGAPGDFAQAYVIAHEIGHHVQNLIGTSEKVHRQRNSPQYNQQSVRLELQADFYAGVWAHHAQRMRNILEPGDIDEALNAANAIGDDRLQKRSQGYVVPDSFTHGTSAQRVKWFKAGFQSGKMEDGEQLIELPYQRL